MADDIDELLDEVESKFIHPQENEKSENVPSQTIKKRITDETGEIDAAIHSICSITEPIESTSGTAELSVNVQLQKDAKRRCTVVYVGDSAAASGLSGGVTQSACDNLRCTSCDFRVSIFRDFAWDPSTSYLFLRNHMPVFEKIRAKLRPKKGWCAYGCQCQAVSVNVLMELRKVSNVKWVCGSH